MRIYTVHYWTERKDQSEDCEIDIQAVNIYGALDNFIAKGIVHKRVSAVIEKPNVIQNDSPSS